MRKVIYIGTFSLLAQTAVASTIDPVNYNYDTKNGAKGYYSFVDDSYDGSGNPNAAGSLLTGGTGDLTDGVIATQHYWVDNVPYVGWRRGDDEVENHVQITFDFGADYIFDSVTVHYDDPWKTNTGPLSRISVDGSNSIDLDNPVGDMPTSATLDLQGFVSDQLVLDLYGDERWMFVSEITFSGSISPVPVPAGAALLATALGGLFAVRRRRASAQKG